MNNTLYNAIIVLGGGVALDGSIDTFSQARLDRAMQLYRSGTAAAVIVCGSHSYKRLQTSIHTEAQAYADYLEHAGMPRSTVYLESESQETLGNLLFAKMRLVLTHGWHSLLVIPTQNHSAERIEYLTQKIYGPEYSWDILRVGENTDIQNLEREAKALLYTKAINDQFRDGDHDAIYNELLATHPAYGGTRWTIDELRSEL